MFAPLVYLAAVLLLVEEWCWDTGMRLTRALGRWPALAALEERVRALPPYAALCAFVLPGLLLLPVKFLALLAIAHGHALSGIATIVPAKVGGAAVVARIYVLIDSRHGLKDVDNDILKTLDRSAVSYQIVLTKADQVKASELEQRIASTLDALKAHPAAYPEVLTTSSRTGAGMPELRAAMIRLLAERGA